MTAPSPVRPLPRAATDLPCRNLRSEGGTAECRLFGYRGPARRPPKRPSQPRRLGGSRFHVVDAKRMVTRSLPPAPAPRHALPVLGSENPCAGAPCRTSDHRRGAPRCQGLSGEVIFTKG